MGTEFQIVLAGDDERALEIAANHAFEEIERIDAQMSLYKPDSELCWINAHAAEEPVRLEPGLFRVLDRAEELNRETDGAFDVTVGPLIECWGFFRGQGAMPLAGEIEKVLGRVGMEHVRLDPREKTVRFDQPGIKIDLGGIAKGYAVDRAADLLKESGVGSALIHGGRSTVYALGRPPEGDAWRVGIRHPYDADRRLRTVDLMNRALSTSGSYEKSFEHEGVRYSHILDPRTGRPVQGMLSASAVTEAALDGDALSTAFFVMGIEKTKEYCSARPEIGAVLASDLGRGVEPQAVTIGPVQ